MRAVIQRVTHATVSIGGQIKGQIARGLLVLIAVEDADTAEDIEWLSGKIVRLRIFPDDEGLMNLSVQDIGGALLLISQFTLFASTKKAIGLPTPDLLDPRLPYHFTRHSNPVSPSISASRHRAVSSVRICK